MEKKRIIENNTGIIAWIDKHKRHTLTREWEAHKIRDDY